MKVSRKLSISIVNFNSGDYLLKCLQSLHGLKDDIDLYIWIVDNASSDDSLEMVKKEYPKLNYIENLVNVGFGRANNQALKKIKSEFILILNPDTEISDGILLHMMDHMEQNPEVGAATCKILLNDGSLDWASHRGFPTPLASLLYFMGNDSQYHLSGKPLDQPHEIDAISGSFFLTRKSVLDKVGLFDEDYFMYAEDIDLCFRIKKAGFKVMYVPDVSIVHHKGVSSGLKKHSQEITTADLETRRRSLDAFYGTMKIFYQKHYEKKYPSIINWLIFLGINIKWWLAKRSMSV